MKRLLPFCALLCATLPAFAFVDSNNNGLSDLWERTYNNGQLFGSSFDPQSDADGDGWTNAQEAAAGTNPLDPNPPEGIVRPQLTNIPAVWSEPDENGDSVIVTPASMFMEWQTIPGKQYSLLYSADLIEWLAVPNETFIGSGSIWGYGIELSTDDKLFWRVKIEDVDSDAEELTDAEEAALGTDPNNQETLAGYPDMWLVENYLSDLLNDEFSSLDLNGDPDEDGLTNAQEKKLGTNPAVSDNPGIVQDSIRNGDFSHPQIGSGERPVHDPTWSQDQTWDYWEGQPPDAEGKTSWTAVVGTNIKHQTITPKDGCGQYVELKAEPTGHFGIKQQVGTRIGVTYLLVLDCRTRPGTDAANNNFSVIIDSEDPKPITFTAHTGWISKAISFKATDVKTDIALVPDNNANDTMGCLVDNVQLNPVDLDIIHPATGELAESDQHSSAKGGYVAVLRDDDTPITELVIRPQSASTTGMKYRVMFSGGTKYNLWKDIARTQSVSSETTEFDPATETTLFFEGLVKSNSIGAETLILQAVIGSDVIDTDTIYCTVVEAEFDVWINIFIPIQWTDSPPSHPIHWDIVTCRNMCWPVRAARRTSRRASLAGSPPTAPTGAVTTT